MDLCERSKKLPCSCGELCTQKLERIIYAIQIYSNTSGVKSCAIKSIDDQLLREKIKPLANNNINITESLHLLLFYTWDKRTPAINSFDHLPATNISAVTDFRNKQVKKSKQAKKSNAKSFDISFIHNVQNTYQALGAGLKIAAEEQVEAILIEDLHYEQIDTLLQLKQNGLRSVAFLALNSKNHK